MNVNQKRYYASNHTDLMSLLMVMALSSYYRFKSVSVPLYPVGIMK